MFLCYCQSNVSVRKSVSRLSFVILTALLIGGFSNFMIPDAHAATATVNSARILTNDGTTFGTFIVVWNIPVDFSTVGAGDFSTLIIDSGACTIDSVSGITPGTSATVSFSSCASTITSSSTGTVNIGAIGDIGSGNDVAINISQTLADGQTPNFSSAVTATSTRIDVTFDESMADPGATPGDFVIGGNLTNSPIVSAITVSGSDLQLTLNAEIIVGDIVTVAFTNSGIRPTDTSTTTINLADFTAQSVTNNSVTNNIVAPTTSSNNGGGCSDCEAPTLGINSKSKRLVDNGFTYNGKSIDVERFFTPYPLIIVNIGENNTAIFKVYEDKGPQNIKHFSFAFGLAKNEIISQSMAIIELDIDYEGNETVSVTDPENALDNIKVSTNIENCNGNDSDMQCLIITIDHTFRAPLEFNIVATDVWDMKRNAWQNYYNHGIEVTGESVNPPKEYDGINKGHIYHLTETKNGAVDEFGNSWTFEYGVWSRDYIPIQKEIDEITMLGYARYDSNFNMYKYGQHLVAETKLIELCSHCFDEPFEEINNIFTYELPERLNKLENPEMQQNMTIEEQKAKVILDKMLRHP